MTYDNLFFIVWCLAVLFVVYFLFENFILGKFKQRSWNAAVIAMVVAVVLPSPRTQKFMVDPYWFEPVQITAWRMK